METDRRRRLVRELVALHQITSQEELVELLSQEGVVATQPTVSRDLEVLGIAKVRGANGRLVYAVPNHAGLAQVLRQFAIGIDASGNLAVARTPPGVAAAVAAAIDAGAIPEILATIQGDDTVLIVAVEGISGREVADRLTAIKEDHL
jgi:transcriptional regulator of arginine metabolism